MRLRVHVLREVLCPMLLLVPAGCRRSTPEPPIGGKRGTVTCFRGHDRHL